MLTRVIAEYIAGARTQALPAAAAEQAMLHTLDTIAAMVCGSTLDAGRKVIPFVRSLGGPEEATVIGSRVVTTVMNAALANGMAAHADETDDSHAPSLTHPGCAIVPAALAAAERNGRSGRELVRAVAAGYDIGTRIASSLGGGLFLDHYLHSSHAFGGVFGATAAAAVGEGLDADRSSHAIAYAVQLASGIPCWLGESDRIEKAFMFGGMPAQGGVQAAIMASAGFTGSSQPLEGSPGLLAAFPDKANPARATEELGVRFEIARTTIKKWSVASPIQSALNGLEELINEHKFSAGDVVDILISLPPRRAEAVDNRVMPDINVQYQLALLLLDGEVTFASAHDQARMNDPHIQALRARISVVARQDAEEGGQAHLKVKLADGRLLEKQVRFVRGTPGNPMTVEEVAKKARGLMDPVLGAATSEKLVNTMLRIDELGNVRELRPFLQC